MMSPQVPPLANDEFHTEPVWLFLWPEALPEIEIIRYGFVVLRVRWHIVTFPLAA